MFKFNFEENSDDAVYEDNCPDPILKECNEIYIKDIQLELFASLKTNVLDLSKGKVLKYIKLSSLKNLNDILQLQILLNSSNDLIPNYYEGGFKVWECSFDLIKYLTNADVNFMNMEVLELGCGAGLLGIYASLHSAKSVALQDYNEEVIKYFTIGNVFLNTKKEFLNKFQFYSGSWKALGEQFSKNNDKFDFILTAETIYNKSSYSSLYNLFVNHLKDNGKIYVAAKTFYFGVGGSTNDFTKFIISKNTFSVEKFVTHQEGVQREILLIEKLKH